MADFNDYQSQFFYQPTAAEEWIRQHQRIDRQFAELQYRLEIGNDLDLIRTRLSRVIYRGLNTFIRPCWVLNMTIWASEKW